MSRIGHAVRLITGIALLILSVDALRSQRWCAMAGRFAASLLFAALVILLELAYERP